MARTGYVDLADIRTCRDCDGEYLRAFDAADPFFPIRLEPWSARGEDVASGWYLCRDGSTPRWAVHIARVAEPGVMAFHPHRCEPARSAKKGTSPVTTPDPFGSAAPPGASGPAMNELDGKLVLFTLHAIERGITTSNGLADAAKGELVDLTNGEVHSSHAMWGKVIVPQFASAAPGTRFVGRVTKGAPTGTQSPPWTWVDGDANDKAVAVKYLTYAARQSVGSTQAAPATPAPAAQSADPWAAPPAAAPAAPAPAAPPWA